MSIPHDRRKKSDSSRPDDLYPSDEVSKVHDELGAWRKLEKLDRMLGGIEGKVERIPVIAEKVDNIGERVTRVEEQIRGVKERVERVEPQVARPHDCFQVDNIEKIEVAGYSLRKDVEDDTRRIDLTEQRLALVHDDVKGIKEQQTADETAQKSNRSSSFFFWVGLVISVLTTIGAIIWYARGVSAAIEIESTTRASQDKQIEITLDRVSKQADTGPILEKIEKLQQAVDRNGMAHMMDWCGRLSDDEIQRIKLALPRHSWPECARLKLAP